MMQSHIFNYLLLCICVTYPINELYHSSYTSSAYNTTNVIRHVCTMLLAVIKGQQVIPLNHWSPSITNHLLKLTIVILTTVSITNLPRPQLLSLLVYTVTNSLNPNLLLKLTVVSVYTDEHVNHKLLSRPKSYYPSEFVEPRIHFVYIRF